MPAAYSPPTGPDGLADPQGPTPDGPAAALWAGVPAALRVLFVLGLTAGVGLWAQQLSKEYIHAGERLLAVKVPGTGVTPGALTATLTADRHLITAGKSATLRWDDERGQQRQA